MCITANSAVDKFQTACQLEGFEVRELLPAGGPVVAACEFGVDGWVLGVDVEGLPVWDQFAEGESSCCNLIVVVVLWFAVGYRARSIDRLWFFGVTVLAEKLGRPGLGHFGDVLHRPGGSQYLDFTVFYFCLEVMLLHEQINSEQSMGRTAEARVDSGVMMA